MTEAPSSQEELRKRLQDRLRDLLDGATADVASTLQRLRGSAEDAYALERIFGREDPHALARADEEETQLAFRQAEESKADPRKWVVREQLAKDIEANYGGKRSEWSKRWFLRRRARGGP